MKSLKKQFLFWCLLAFFLRLLTAATQLSFHHPDEWAQTIDLGHFLAFGFTEGRYEFFAHLRNLNAALFFRFPLQLAHWIDPLQPWWKLFIAKLSVGLCDLVILMWLLSASFKRFAIDDFRFRNFMYACFVLPFFLIMQSVRTSSEHLSELVVLVIVILFVERKFGFWRSLLVGFLLVLVGSLRYPSLLFSVGIMAALVCQFVTKRQPSEFKMLYCVLGVLLGLLTLGLADWIYYGRPWESLWMYFQFNFLTGLSEKYFGKQGAEVYFLYFWKNFGRDLLVWGDVILILASFALFSGLKRLEVWSWGLLFYIAGHALPAHKEGRFMAPLLSLIIWSALVWVWQERGRISKIFHNNKRFLQLFLFMLLTSFVANAIKTVEVLRGDLWKARGEYFRALDFLKNEKPCALLSPVPLPTSLVPWFSEAVPAFPIAQFAADQPAKMDEAFLKTIPLVWLDRKPNSCEDRPSVYLQVWRGHESFWQEQACELRELDTNLVTRFIARKAESVVFYQCPAKVIDLFQSSSDIEFFVRTFKKIEQLPKWGSSADDFLQSVSSDRNFFK